MSKIMIRRMAEGDLEKVFLIEQDCFSEPWSINAFRNDLKNELALPLVAEFENTIVGYSNIYIVADEVQIGNLAVASGFRNRGVGKRLIHEIIDVAGSKGCDFIYLEVRKSNQAAQDLYKSFGFKEQGIRKNYYRNPSEDAILMAVEL